jgi:hypothetical protein
MARGANQARPRTSWYPITPLRSSHLCCQFFAALFRTRAPIRPGRRRNNKAALQGRSVCFLSVSRLRHFFRGTETLQEYSMQQTISPSNSCVALHHYRSSSIVASEVYGIYTRLQILCNTVDPALSILSWQLTTAACEQWLDRCRRILV